MGLLTAGVLGFQVLILISMLIAASNSRQALNLVTIGWVLFTALGSIFTFGLLLLQFLTIALGYNWGTGMVTSEGNETSMTLGRTAYGVWNFIRITIIACLVIGWLVSEYLK